MIEETRADIILVKQQLWRNGYSARDVSDVTEYDLIVDKKIKVEVKTAECRQTKTGIQWVLHDVTLAPISADVMAIVVETTLRDIVIFYMHVTTHIFESMDTSNMITSMRKHEDGHVTGKIKLSTKHLKELCTDKPSQIFNK